MKTWGALVLLPAAASTLVRIRSCLARASGVMEPEKRRAAKARIAVEDHLHILTPEADATVLRAGGFREVELSSQPLHGAAGSDRHD